MSLVATKPSNASGNGAERFGDAILQQLRRMGCSCDWSRTRFTMDEGLNLGVRHAFVKLYEEGLIYRGKRIVNWCPVDQTALSDDEVEKDDEKGKMYRIRYPLADDRSKYVVVATTRPETLFGDVAVAVHPEDERYRHLIGKQVVVPLQERLVKVVGDEHADPEMGTGCVKITPAHDPNDFEVGQRHDLEQINVMHADATMNDVVPERFRGLDRYVCRKKAVAELEEAGLLEGVDDHVLAIGRSYRSKVPIEFRLSEQWFVKTGPMAEDALKKSGYRRDNDGWKYEPTAAELHLHPPRFEKIYFHWLSNIRDWCISRQIWWGHRIPAWHHKTSGEILVAMETPEAVLAAPQDWSQDEDVLDTWFSSGLWPMSTLGWPNPSPDYTRYYPTQVLSTAKDILFFWVARMNFAGLTFDGRLPYRDVYLHATVADAQGVSMSKSKGNGIDPLALIEGASMKQLQEVVLEARPANMKELLKRIEKNHPEGFEAVGADAMRWTLIYSINDGDYVRLSLSRFTDGRNFVTKLWNGAGRIIQALQAECGRSQPGAPCAEPTEEDQWLLARLDTTIRAVRQGLDDFDFGAVGQRLYQFVWDEYCAWALELSKVRLDADDDTVRRGALRVMGSVLGDMLRLLHPIVPFVTEELWQRLKQPMDQLGLWMDRRPGFELLIEEAFPTPRQDPQTELEERFAILQRFVMATRQMRATSVIKDSVKVDVQVKALHKHTQPMLEQAMGAVCFLARIGRIDFVSERNKGMAAQYDPAFELYLDLASYVDIKEEFKRLEKEISRSQKELEQVIKRLDNPKFAERAAPEAVDEARARRRELEGLLVKLQETLQELRDVHG
ncbi:MAG: valine--tRNA ligase [Myxococcota bacterium]